MRVGFVQCAPAFGDLDVTLTRIENLLDGCETDIIMLPELCNSGYNFESYDQAWETSEGIGHSVFIDYLLSKCKELDAYIVAGFNERDGPQLYNSAVLVGPQGYLGTYRKLHLFMREKDFFTPGNTGLEVFDLGICRVGLLICFDWIFPEVWRILALKGADVICHPSNLVLPGLAQRAVPIHALMNRVFVVTANRVGREGHLFFTGLSTIADARGNIVIQASRDHEELGIVDIDISDARDKKITERNDLFLDRRPQEYIFLVEDT